MKIVAWKINKLEQFAKEYSHSIDFRFDKNDFWIGVYCEDGTATIFARGFHGNFNDRNGRNLDDMIRQAKIFIENHTHDRPQQFMTDMINNLPTA